MFCARCGAENDENAFRCTTCGEELLRPEQAPPIGPTGAPVEQTWLVPSILATIFCCLPAGIVAIVYGAMASSSNGVGDFGKARQYARSAQTWFWVSFALGLVLTLPYLIILIIGAAAGGSGGTWP